MQALSIPSRTDTHSHRRARVMTGISALFGLFRMLWPGRPSTTMTDMYGDDPVLWDAHGSMVCGNYARSWRVLSEWLKSRGDQPEDYGWLSTRILEWEDARVVTRLTEARVGRLLALRRSAEVLDVVAHRLTVDPNFRPDSAADTLTLAQIAARGGALRISRILLSDFATRFEGDPRVAISEALKRHLTPQAPVRLRA